MKGGSKGGAAMDAFFSLTDPVDQFDREKFEVSLRTSRHICNVMYMPDVLADKRVEGVTFENVSFSKTVIRSVNFKECKFINCLFIATKFEASEFHDCNFYTCNFYKSSFSHVYAKPAQFIAAVPHCKYSNVGIHLFQQLRNNYSDEMQPEFLQEAEFWFKYWKRKQHWNEFIWKPSIKRFGSWAGSWLYGITFGYGLRARNLLVTTVVVVFSLSAAAYKLAPLLFVSGNQVSFVESLYFTIATMITMGAAGFIPVSDAGYLYVIVNALLGIVLLSAAVNAIAKRVAR